MFHLLLLLCSQVLESGGFFEEGEGVFVILQRCTWFVLEFNQPHASTADHLVGDIYTCLQGTDFFH